MSGDKIKELHKKLELARTRPVNVLLEGEQGVGKEYYARLIHEKRAWAEDFVIFDWECEHSGQIRVLDDLIMNQLAGIINPSNEKKNTYFFRRVDLLSSQAQEKIIDALESKAKRRGLSKSQLHQLNLIASAEKKNGNGVRCTSLALNPLYPISEFFPFGIAIPALRQKKEELFPLMRTILESVNKQHNRRVSGFSIEAFSFLLDYDWPNNVDELRSEIERMVTLTRDNDLIRYQVMSEKLIKHRKVARIENFVG